MNCTRDEICAFLDVAHTTLVRACERDNGITWKEFYEQAKLGGNVSLRRKSYLKALQGDTQMLKHNLKHRLGEHDKLDVGFDPDKPVKFVLDMGKNIQKENEDDKEN